MQSRDACHKLYLVIGPLLLGQKAPNETRRIQRGKIIDNKDFWFPFFPPYRSGEKTEMLSAVAQLYR